MKPQEPMSLTETFFCFNQPFVVNPTVQDIWSHKACHLLARLMMNIWLRNGELRLVWELMRQSDLWNSLADSIILCTSSSSIALQCEPWTPKQNWTFYLALDGHWKVRQTVEYRLLYCTTLLWTNFPCRSLDLKHLGAAAKPKVFKVHDDEHFASEQEKVSNKSQRLIVSVSRFPTIRITNQAVVEHRCWLWSGDFLGFWHKQTSWELNWRKFRSPRIAGTL